MKCQYFSAIIPSLDSCLVSSLGSTRSSWAGLAQRASLLGKVILCYIGSPLSFGDGSRQYWGGEGGGQAYGLCFVGSHGVYHLSKPVGDVLRRYGVSYHQYGDDTQLHISPLADQVMLSRFLVKSVRVFRGKNPSKEWVRVWGFSSIGKSEQGCTPQNRTSAQLMGLAGSHCSCLRNSQ